MCFDGDSIGLAQTVGAVLSLKMIGRNPVEVLEDHVACGCERDADPASDDVASRDPYLVVVEAIDGFHALLGVVRPGDCDALSAEDGLVPLQSFGKGSENNHLSTRGNASRITGQQWVHDVTTASRQVQPTAATRLQLQNGRKILFLNMLYPYATTAAIAAGVLMPAQKRGHRLP